MMVGGMVGDHRVRGEEWEKAGLGVTRSMSRGDDVRIASQPAGWIGRRAHSHMRPRTLQPQLFRRRARHLQRYDIAEACAGGQV